MSQKNKSVEEYLNEINYRELYNNNYIPTKFSLEFVNFIKMVNGGKGEQNVTPVYHYKMIDSIVSKNPYSAFMLFRGSAKTTIMIEYLPFFLCFKGKIPRLGLVDAIIYVSDSIDNGVKSARQNMEKRYENSKFLQQIIPKTRFTETFIEMTNASGNYLGIKLFGAKSGIRGTKINNKRPQLLILDDLVDMEDSQSKTAMKKIKDSVYKDAMPALEKGRQKIIFCGTPFNKTDILYEAIESGAWDINIYPVCEKFPVEKEEFYGAWEDRFSYETIKREYEFLKSNGKLDAFYQEYMLQIRSDEERLISDSDIQWFNREIILKNLSNFNVYITTDFATSDKETADFNVISVWAYSNNGDLFLLDGFCERVISTVAIDNLFYMVQKYNPQSVGIEVTGQQLAFVYWIQEQMHSKNIFFNIAYEKNKNSIGIRPNKDKLSRFNLSVPYFKSKKIYFPNEIKNTPYMLEMVEELKMATVNGLKGKDDCLDTISMLNYMSLTKPNKETKLRKEDDIFKLIDYSDLNDNPINSYLVD